ncbi:expressed unknown protein [Seminavis robusta]|uniref:Transmembrane protein n=1 Tax=Seminavis robusta TaxID=568900 RepID=A0A9N8DDZ5_9STRA|nr:expressed unknown protein [Seminavis robusta]|eukprot:Sro110_g055100.1 n/a (528) ;mRNA; r:110722-112540
MTPTLDVERGSLKSVQPEDMGSDDLHQEATSDSSGEQHYATPQEESHTQHTRQESVIEQSNGIPGHEDNEDNDDQLERIRVDAESDPPPRSTELGHGSNRQIRQSLAQKHFHRLSVSLSLQPSRPSQEMDSIIMSELEDEAEAPPPKDYCCSLFPLAWQDLRQGNVFSPYDGGHVLDYGHEIIALSTVFLAIKLGFQGVVDFSTDREPLLVAGLCFFHIMVYWINVLHFLKYTDMKNFSILQFWLLALFCLGITYYPVSLDAWLEGDERRGERRNPNTKASDPTQEEETEEEALSPQKPEQQSWKEFLHEAYLDAKSPQAFSSFEAGRFVNFFNSMTSLAVTFLVFRFSWRQATEADEDPRPLLLSIYCYLHVMVIFVNLRHFMKFSPDNFNLAQVWCVSFMVLFLTYYPLSLEYWVEHDDPSFYFVVSIAVSMLIVLLNYFTPVDENEANYLYLWYHRYMGVVAACWFARAFLLSELGVSGAQWMVYFGSFLAMIPLGGDKTQGRARGRTDREQSRLIPRGCITRC